jgi:hypothetical protein
MDNQQIFDYLDELLLHQKGKRLNTLQAKILRGVLTGKKYIDIAREYNCTLGHAKDEASKLWKFFSRTLGEDICKRNLIATIERKSQKIDKEWIH